MRNRKHPVFRKKTEFHPEHSHHGFESHGDNHSGHAHPSSVKPTLHRVLGVRDLTFLGIAAIIGGGVFSSIGKACASGGPGIVWLFLFCGIACGFAALCYAEFASRIPIAGSAYTYAYASFGEIFAWIIGWALLMEYSIGNIYVAYSWSGYFNHLLQNMGIHMPEWLVTDYSSAKSAFIESQKNLKLISPDLTAWKTSPIIGGLHIILDLPAFIINILITLLVLVGIRESRWASNLMVIIKLVVVALVVLVGIFYIDTNNYEPFHPNGFNGIMGAVSSVFFTFIGFDAVSTMSEESKNPTRDLPRGMLYSLAICTVLYIFVALILTGMVPFSALGVDDPLAQAMALKGVKWLEAIISVSAVVAMTSVLLVYQMGQPRIWMSMSRDGLLPKKFSEIHPKFKTPYFSTIITGVVVGIPILFTNEKFVLDFTSIGTLFAFVLVCGGVLLLPKRPKTTGKSKGFRLPHISGIYYIFIMAGIILTSIFLFPNYFLNIVTFPAQNHPDFIKICTFNISNIVFWVTVLFLIFLTIKKHWTLIPLLGLTCCLYLLTGMEAQNWKWFFIWFLIGLIIYFVYGKKHSVLNRQK